VTGRITVADFRRHGYCASGVRAFYARHDLDYSELLREGTPVESLRETGDGMALAVIEEVEDGRRR
jgi:hypothetical protein